MEARKRNRAIDLDLLLSDIQAGSRQALGKAITLIESSLPEDNVLAAELLSKLNLTKTKSIRIGITGVPGVGKSTFIESFGIHLADAGHKIAVLAVDPSSSKNKGSILGDKTRMNKLSIREEVFIRPSPAGQTLGGLARSTNESILLCEAAGHDVILVETVGVGQSETLVKQSVDFFLLLMLSGAGDELQGIKRGIMELADLLVVTKADGYNIKAAKRAAAEYKNAMHLFPPNENGWIPSTQICSALENSNLDKVWEVIQSFQNQTTINGWFEKNRKDQQKFWLNQMVENEILRRVSSESDLRQRLKNAETKIMSANENPFVLAQNLVNELFEKFKL